MFGDLMVSSVSVSGYSNLALYHGVWMFGDIMVSCGSV